jgi:hypothetical protein
MKITVIKKAGIKARPRPCPWVVVDMAPTKG